MNVDDCELKDVRLALFFKDFSAWVKSSCVGLNVAGYTTANYLNHHGIDTSVFPVRHNVDLVNAIDNYNETHDKRLTHVVISAPWLSLYDLKNIIITYPEIKFVILSHSNVGFLQADPCGVELLRKYDELSKIYNNIKVGGNNLPFVEWFETAYDVKSIYLPNLYPIDHIRSKVWDGVSPLKIGAFGAIRPEKNFMTAAAAAMAIHSILDIPIELHMSSGGEECQSTTLRAIEQMFNNVKGVKLVKHHWDFWDKFIRLISSMDLLLQPSFTESFNMVTADGISRGVSSVVSPVIRWAPESWKANPDDAINIANVGIDLLMNDQEHLGSDALHKHNHSSFKHWIKFLENK